MRSLRHLLLAALAALLLGLPSIGSGGGGGDGGVWILPNCMPLTGLTFQDSIIQAPRSSYDVTAISSNLTLVLPAGMGPATFNLTEMPSTTPLPVSVVGQCAIIPKETLRYLLNGSGRAQGLIVDAATNGFMLTIVRLDSGGLRLMVN